MTPERINAAASPHGLSIFGMLHPTPEDGLPETVQTIVLLGLDEPGFWAGFTASPEFNDGAEDPLDRWSERVITALAESLGAAPLFPFGGPPYQPFIRWARDSGRAHQSPVGLLVHDRAGLMVSYRGALAFEARMALPPTLPRPCDSCEGQPCRSACPVDALSGPSYDVAACKADLLRDGNDCLSRGCAVRRACPLSQSYGRVEAQSAFHMKAFL